VRDTGKVHAWLAAAKAGDEEAFRSLLTLYYPALFRLVFQMVPRAEDAEEILQDTFYRFYRALARLRADEDPFPFLRTIAVRTTYSFLKHHRRRHLSLEELPEELAHLPVQELHVEVATLYRWAARLPPQQRMVFLLREVLGVEDAAIADMLGIREPTVRRHASLAREAFKRDLGSL